jgi:RimJ/RimL family protein N-acetyltransferase
LALLLADRGFRAMVTKVETSNEASRRAVTKAGFREVAIQRYHRRGPA